MNCHRDHWPELETLVVNIKLLFCINLVQEYFNAEIGAISISFVGLIHGRLLVNAWEEGIENTEDQVAYYSYIVGLHRISGRPDIRPFLISGIRPDIRFRLPDIRSDIRLEKLF